MLTIEYEGTNYCGWQFQKNVISVQETIEIAIQKITGCKPNLNGSGRTDKGVHALGQVANFFTESKITGEKFAFALNAVLPRDIVIKASREVEMDFHARYNAKSKQYSYLILNSRHPTALYRNLAYHISYCDRLNIKQMHSASQHFLGTHDFSGFMATGNMVRIISGTILFAGIGKIDPNGIPMTIATMDRTKVGKTLPAHGLYLEKVLY
jgi:tRNA pseudouridine38-40 synthase